MCGFFGLYGENLNDISPSQTKKIHNYLYHRGPDDFNYLNLSNFYFSHTRLSILGIDDKNAIQPISKKNLILLFNGEIYNYKYLSNILIQNNILSEYKSDTDVLINYIATFGLDKTLQDIDGMFAFSIYDKKNKSLTLVRDRYGEKSIYWSLIKNKLIFSSEIKSILEFTDKEINTNSLPEYFNYRAVLGTKTLFKNINELEQGCKVSFNLNNITKPKYDNYYNLEDTLKYKENISYDKLKEIINENISSTFFSDVKNGLLLSAGIDSNLILNILLNKKEELNCYTYANSYQSDESKQVKEIVNKLKNIKSNKINHKIVNTKLHSYLTNAEKITWYNDEPIQYMNIFNLDELLSNVKNDNCKVLLCGEGADEIFFGYNRFKNSYDSYKKLQNKNLNNINDLIYFGSGITNKIIIQNLLSNYNPYTNLSEAYSWLENNNNYDFNTKQMIFNQKFRLPTRTKLMDRVGMKNSIEIRSPFLRKEIVEYVNSFIIESKFINEIPKALLLKILSLKTYEKKGSPSDFEEYIKYNFDEFKEILLSQNSFISNHMDKKLLINILDKFNIKYNFIYLSLLNLEIWYKVFFKDNYNIKQI